MLPPTHAHGWPNIGRRVVSGVATLARTSSNRATSSGGGFSNVGMSGMR
jgi:hypothetical protein